MVDTVEGVLPGGGAMTPAKPGIPELIERIAQAVSRNDLVIARHNLRLAADALTGQRGERVKRLLAKGQTMTPLQIGGGTAHWSEVTDTRSPWVPQAVKAEIERWLKEAEHAESLAAAGERVMPLLLSGPTRCGKTSSIVGAAQTLGMPVFRMSLGTTINSHLGETCKLLAEALCQVTEGSIWLIDEIDGVAGTRTSGGVAADREHSRSIGVMLTLIDSMKPGALLAATTNRDNDLDPAILARFRRSSWPSWLELTQKGRESFAQSHIPGADEGTVRQLAESASSHEDVVKRARDIRVAAILAPEGSVL